MGKDVQATSVVICDDVRREASGKEILIGTYAGVIYFPSLPATLTTFATRIEFKTELPQADDITVELRGSDDTALFSVTGFMEMVGTEGVQVLTMIANNVHFPKEDTYNILFGRKGSVEKIYSFPVKAKPY
jgi:hypothetical protein